MALFWLDKCGKALKLRPYNSFLETTIWPSKCICKFFKSNMYIQKKSLLFCFFVPLSILKNIFLYVVSLWFETKSKHLSTLCDSIACLNGWQCFVFISAGTFSQFDYYKKRYTRLVPKKAHSPILKPYPYTLIPLDGYPIWQPVRVRSEEIR